jgi:hypothetical protein
VTLAAGGVGAAGAVMDIWRNRLQQLIIFVIVDILKIR